ncbi:cysteine desulfurase [Verrucomicrobium sp. GAS474]|uniref:cysteine desulfurase family protein n=1 Tax=Verrucomicrobium sp. GAS474 TaxID=1882831 RepID=UPI00087DA1F5|nr:cysteine desulfurase family protein [Verrucomicrobium sp. GAS474]SDT99560.1 cysteine desulfurase [Verrucomicrobium sp. GAS474]
MAPSRIYLDHNATTSLDPAVRAAMEPWLGGGGNPSAIHAEGRRARAALDTARDRAAALLKAKPGEIVFTSGGTEGNNLALRGLARARVSQSGRGAPVPRRIVTAATEHHAVLETCTALRDEEGFALEIVPVEASGRLDPARLAEALKPGAALVTAMTANNETGVLHPVAEIAALARAQGIPFHTDAVQSAGKEPLPTELGLPVATMALAAHKFYGPLGAGLLYIELGLPLVPFLRGGTQENQRRPGTENVAAAVGLVEALALAHERREAEHAREAALVARLWEALRALPGIRRNGAGKATLANTLNVSFSGGLDGENLLISLDLEGLALSSGSACMVGAVKPSHVLLAMGLPEAEARAVLRFSLGRGTTEAEIDEAARRVVAVVARQLKGR